MFPGTVAAYPEYSQVKLGPPCSSGNRGAREKRVEKLPRTAPPRGRVSHRRVPWVFQCFLSLSASGSATCRSLAVRIRCPTKGFLPVRPTQKPLDDHVRKPPGADARGDVVSVELLQNAQTLVFSSRGPSQHGVPPSLRDPRSSLLARKGRVHCSGIRIWRFEPSHEGKLPG